MLVQIHISMPLTMLVTIPTSQLVRWAAISISLGSSASHPAPSSPLCTQVAVARTLDQDQRHHQQHNDTQFAYHTPEWLSPLCTSRFTTRCAALHTAQHGVALLRSMRQPALHTPVQRWHCRPLKLHDQHKILGTHSLFDDAHDLW